MVAIGLNTFEKPLMLSANEPSGKSLPNSKSDGHSILH